MIYIMFVRGCARYPGLRELARARMYAKSRARENVRACEDVREVARARMCAPPNV